MRRFIFVLCIEEWLDRNSQFLGENYDDRMQFVM
jgi:hypothetical protein